MFACDVRHVITLSRWILTHWYTSLRTQHENIAATSTGWTAGCHTRTASGHCHRHQDPDSADSDGECPTT